MYDSDEKKLLFSSLFLESEFILISTINTITPAIKIIDIVDKINIRFL